MVLDSINILKELGLATNQYNEKKGCYLPRRISAMANRILS